VGIVRKRDRGVVFAVYCPHHRSRVLLCADDIETVVNGPSGIDVHWRCPCGRTGVLQTGVEPMAEPAEEGVQCILTY
jgi:hypothetical protein